MSGAGGRDARRLLIIALLACLCLGAFVFSLAMGALPLTLSEIFAALFRKAAGVHFQIIFNIRLPRTLVAGLVGACLSLSGCILQGIMRNPLASPILSESRPGPAWQAFLFSLSCPAPFTC